MSLLGIDVGTTGCKAAVFCADGRCLASAYREYATIQAQPGQAELDSRDVLAKVFETIAEVAAQVDGDPISALCVSSMGEAVTPVSAEREILDGCILSSDVRGEQYVQDLADRIDPEELYRINPNILGVQYSMPKLCWVRDNQPDLYARAEKFLLWGDLVGFMLGGEPVTSFSHANRTGLLDIRAEDWSGKLLDLSGIDPAKLPRPAPSGTLAGTVSPRLARRLGLGDDVRIVVGGHDQCCNALGAGIYQAGRAVCGIGTFECITPVYDHIPDAAAMLSAGLNVEHHVLDGLYVSFLYNQAGCLVRWFRDTFASADRKLLPDGADIYDALAAEMPAEPTRLLVLPYFEITGPPGFVADASGAVVGLRTSTTRGEILKAIMECETFYFIELLDSLKVLDVSASNFVATGGGARSDAWLQIKADILGVPFVRPRNTECSLTGAAILAGLGTGVYASPAEASERFFEVDCVFEPDAARHEVYRRRYDNYAQLYPHLAELLPML